MATTDCNHHSVSLARHAIWLVLAAGTVILAECKCDIPAGMTFPPDVFERTSFPLGSSCRLTSGQCGGSEVGICKTHSGCTDRAICPGGNNFDQQDFFDECVCRTAAELQKERELLQESCQKQCEGVNVTNPVVATLAKLGILKTQTEGGPKLVDSEGIQKIYPDGTVTMVCCVKGASPLTCGDAKECEKDVEVLGMSLSVAVGAFAFLVLATCCCCCCLFYRCCCRKRRSDDSGSGSGSGSDSEGESDDGDRVESGGNEPPVSRAKARGFLKALQDEYVDGTEGAVGDFMEDEHIRGADAQELNDAEERVRDAGDPEGAINSIRRGWGL